MAKCDGSLHNKPYIYVASDKYPLGKFNVSAGKSLYQRESVLKTTDTEMDIAITEKLHLYTNVNGFGTVSVPDKLIVLSIPVNGL